MKTTKQKVLAIKVRQWLDEWDKISFDKEMYRRKPEAHFYVFSLKASDLKALSGIYRRETKEGKLRSEDLNIQRRHDPKRSEEISNYIKYGYPFSDLSQKDMGNIDHDNLRKPGWLPTAIVVNILTPEDNRYNKKVSKDDLIEIEDVDGNVVSINLPKNFSGNKWEPKGASPIEVIDGQHRLWAFENDVEGGDFELPVVAFRGLDISWQAYLFWAINIKPKKINASLAFDLYPLLRTEDWLNKFEGHPIYRETRAQELVESLWSHPNSVWYQRINMLGESGLKIPMVTQSAWINSLMTTYVKPWESRKKSIGGLFGSKLGEHKGVLPWSRAQQAAFLIVVGESLKNSIGSSKAKWATVLRNVDKQDALFGDENKDLAFFGNNTLLNTDQGIRGILYITNDIFYINAEAYGLDKWIANESVGAFDSESVTDAINSLKKQKIITSALKTITDILANYDWRLSSAPDLTENERVAKLAFRGSSGYKELRRQLINELVKDKGDVGKAAKIAQDILKHD